MKKQKTMLVVVLVVSLLGLSVAFAALSTTLTINGSGLVNPDKWNVKFENLQSATVTGTAVVNSEATLTDDTSITGFNVSLKAPGDAVTYTFDVTNAGDIDAKITSFVKATPVCTGLATDDAKKLADATLVSENLIYTLVYTDTNEAVAENDTLEAKATKNLTLKVAYNPDIATLPSSDVEISGLDIDIVYGQN